MQCESKKFTPPWGLVAIFAKRLGIFQPNFTCLLCIPIYPGLEYKFLFSHLQLWLSYAILSETTQFTSCAQDVHYRLKRMLAFSDIFCKQLGNFSPNFTHILKCKFLFNYLQLWRSYAILSATTHRHRVFRSMMDILSTLRWSRLIWHNFVTVGDNWIKMCILICVWNSD